MLFREAFQHSEAAGCLCPGLQALGEYAERVEANPPARFEGSVDLDACLRPLYPQAPRWDYAFGCRRRIYYVEVHHASDSEVEGVIAKYRWLRNWQAQQPDPAGLQTGSSYHWIASGRVTITRNSRYARRLARSGLSYPQRRIRI